MDPTHALLRDVRGFKCDVFVQFMKEKGKVFFKMFLIKIKVLKLKTRNISSKENVAFIIFQNQPQEVHKIKCIWNLYKYHK